jgi:hypothetical protein
MHICLFVAGVCLKMHVRVGYSSLHIDRCSVEAEFYMSIVVVVLYYPTTLLCRLLLLLLLFTHSRRPAASVSLPSCIRDWIL